MRTLTILIGLMMFTAPTHAQVPASDSIVMDRGLFNNTLLRVSPTGQIVSTLGTGFRWSRGYMMGPLNRELATVYPGRPFYVSHWDFVNQQFSRYITAGSRLTQFGLDQNGGYLYLSAGLMRRIDFNRIGTVGAMTELYGLDLMTGDYVGMLGGAVVRMSRKGVVGTTLWSGFYAWGAAQDELDGSWMLIARRGIVSELLRYDTNGQLTRLTTLPGSGHADLNIDVPGTTAPLVFHDSKSTMYRSDRAGNLSTVTVAAVGTLSGLTGYRTRHLATQQRGTVTAPNLFDLRVSFPREPQKAFAVALSTTGFTPSTTVAGFRFPLVFDSATFLSLTGQLSPLLVNNLGLLDAQGEQTATLDLRPLGNVVSGMRVWALAAMFDFATQPPRIRVSNPIVIALD